MTGIRHPEYIDSLESTKYPFIPTASLSNGDATLLEGTFLDASIYAVAGAGRYYISSVVVTSGSITIHVGDPSQSRLLTGEIPLPISVASVPLVDSFGRSGGILVSDPSRLSLMSAWGIGTHNFELRDTEFCVGCQILISDPGVSGIRLPDGSVVTGKVWIVGDDGVQVSAESYLDAEGSVTDAIRIDIVGDPLFLQRSCSSQENYAPISAVRTIRVVDAVQEYDCEADDTGNFNLQMNNSLAEDAALRIRSTDRGIYIGVEGSITRNG